MPINSDTNPRTNSPEPRQFGRGLIILWMWILLLNLFLFRGTESPRVPYSEFINQVEANKVKSAVLGTDRIEYVLKSAQPTHPSAPESAQEFITRPVTLDTDLPRILREHHVEFSAAPSNSVGWLSTVLSWIVPPIILFVFWIWLLGRSQAGGPAAFMVGKSKARIYAEGSTGVTFNDVAGVDEA
ncbi:MAG TPA: ATP-dependent metallopeptidase FtsH/Yme1/Tma family protein, partial [Coleofasciculaceae cyanobacterium]